MCEDVTQGSDLIFALKEWSGHSAFRFHEALETVRKDLTAVACRIPWLCTSEPSEYEYGENERSINSMIDLLKTEIPKGKWKLIYITVMNETGENIGYDVTLKRMLEKGFIKKDLIKLTEVLQNINRYDLTEKLTKYQQYFSTMEEDEFIGAFKRAIDSQEKEQLTWEQKLKQFIQVQHRNVKQMLGKDKSVNLAEVFVDLTIIKEEPRPIDLEDETTYSEIAYLRKTASKEVKIEPVNFTEELKSYEKSKAEIWCLIGNPGCGKTFLAKRTALRISESEIECIYSISIPCRNPDWHELEVTRYENERKIDNEFISEWLRLGLPKGPNWSKDLSKHLTESDGTDLLLIIDGLDEFTKKIQFKNTFLFQLLTREALTRSTIILTSRPGAWTEISSKHELKIDRFYQVLGFSPDNRDLYFQKQINDEIKLNNCKELLNTHDELNQLSLIPVNASLFAALLKGQNWAYFNTLSKLYRELTLYLIRRQLSRMGLAAYAEATKISQLNAGIQQCLYKIGFHAHLGVANRELTSSETVPLIIDQEAYTSHCLGLVHEHYMVESVGIIKQVWTFPHLTMQEFASALFLNSTRWTQQCYSVRYISHSTENFALFKMVVRFLCGLLCDESAAILSILYRYLTPSPVAMDDLPMKYQLNFDSFTSTTGWHEFTNLYLQLAVILFETSSKTIPKWFSYFRNFLPQTIYLYIESSISPNEWLCLLKSFHLIPKIQVLYFDTVYVNSSQFISLLNKLTTTSISHLVLRFSDKDYTTVLSYTEPITEAVQKCNTKISIELYSCDLTGVTAVDHLFPTDSITLYFMSLAFANKYSEDSLQQLSKQLASLDYFRIYDSDKKNIDTILPALYQATQLKGLYLHVVNKDSIQPLKDVLPKFSNLQEIQISHSILLRSLHSLTNLSGLSITDYRTKDTTLCCYLLKLLNNNISTLRGVLLWFLDRIGIRSWIEFLGCIQLCNKLVEIDLSHASIEPDDVTLWCSAVSKCKYLVCLHFYEVTLYDRGLISICEGLLVHPAIRDITVLDCDNTSVCCKYLMYLIPTLSKLERLTVDNLSTPDYKPLKKLIRTADEWGIEHDFHIPERVTATEFDESSTNGIQSTSSEEQFSFSVHETYSNEDVHSIEETHSSEEDLTADETNPNDLALILLKIRLILLEIDLLCLIMNS